MINTFLMLKKSHKLENLIEKFLEWILFCSNNEVQIIYLKLIQCIIENSVLFFFL